MASQNLGWLWVGVTVGVVAFPDPSDTVLQPGRGTAPMGTGRQQGWMCSPRVLSLQGVGAGRGKGAGTGMGTGAGTDKGAAALGCSVPTSHHGFGAKGMLSAASERLFPRMSLIQGTFNRSFRVLKHKPITPQRPPGPRGDECCTWPCFLLLYPWRPHVARGTGMSQHLSGTLSPLVLPSRAFLAPRASVSLLHVPPRLADSNFSTACWK